jgi:hypothetical protein
VDRIRRGTVPIARLALLAQGVYILVISSVPFVRLWTAPDAVADHDRLVLQFALWSVVPAVTLLVAGWAVGQGLQPLAQRALRGAATVSTAYLALGCLISLADPSTTELGRAISAAVLVAVALGALGLARLAPKPAGVTLVAPSLRQGSSSRSTTTIR